MPLGSALGSDRWRGSVSSGKQTVSADEPSAPAEDETSSLLHPHTANVEIAAGKAIGLLLKIDTHGFISVERRSVYGAAVAIPQIARSAGWSATYLALTLRSWFFLLLTILIQGFLLAVMNEEAHVSNAFAGKPHLCDFGAFIPRCPDGPNCLGPGGTTYDFERLQHWEAWSTRVFFRDALKSLFPERLGEIAEAADPGEYGLEDYYCRLLCCLLFVMAVVDDLRSTLELGVLLYGLPTAPETWIKYEAPEWMAKPEAKQVHGWCELDLVRFQVAGMPLCWKLTNVVVVLLPKAYIWSTLVSTGFHFLMETAGITDLVINCMALKFVLGMDELIFARLATDITKYMLENLEDVARFDTGEEDTETQEACLERLRRDQSEDYWSKILVMVIPRRLFYIVALSTIFLLRYYFNHCDCLEDGSCVSKPIYPPRHLSYNPLAFIHGSLLERTERPIWSMPTG